MRKPRKEPWQKRLANDKPEVIAAIGAPRSGERIGQYLLRWQRHLNDASLKRLSEAMKEHE